jgi:GNAT acetyltransferase-like protein
VTTSPLRLEVVDAVEGFDALHDRWDDAAGASADPNVFLTWEWLRTWWRHFGEPPAGDRGGRGGRGLHQRLHLVVVSDGDGIVAALPLLRWQRRLGPLRVTALRQVSHDAGDYGGALLVRRHGEAIRLLVDHLAAQLRAGVDVVVLSRLTSRSTWLTGLLAELGEPGGEDGARPAGRRSTSANDSVDDAGTRPPRRRRRGRPAGDSRRMRRRGGPAAVVADLGDACPYADLRDGYDLRRHLKKHKVRQRLRRLTEKHADTEFTYHSGPTLDDGLARLVDVHSRRWDDHGDEQQGQLADPGREAFLLDAVRALDRRGCVRLITLTADGTTVAADLDFELGGRLWMFKGAIHPDYTEFSPGQLVTYRTFEDGMERGVEEIDFMRGDHPYKRRWTNAERRLATVTLTRPGLRGRLALTRYRASRPAKP